MANNNGHHSFYREQQKSILGQEKWTAKRIGKLLLTLMKWFLWGFLIVATLWGCVNEFIIQTSKNLGQGVEFYQADDFVYPNTYQAYNLTGYTSSKEAVEEGTIKHDGTTLDYVNDKEKNYEQTTPFNFTIANPYLAMSDEDWNDIDPADLPAGANRDDLFVNAIDWVEAGGDVDAIYYNLNLITFSYVGALGHDAADMVVDGSWMMPFSLSTNLKDLINENLDAEIYEVLNTTDFYYYLLDLEQNGTQTNNVTSSTTETENVYWTDEAEDDGVYTIDEATSLKGTLLANDVSLTKDNFDSLANWNVVSTLNQTLNLKDEETTADDVLVYFQDMIKKQVNQLAFNNGTGISSSTDYLAMETEDGQLLSDWYYEQYVSAMDEIGETPVASIDPSYAVDFNTSLLNTGQTIYGGAQTIITPIKKGFPVRISEHDQKLMDSTWRGEDFYKWDTSESEHQDAGFDVENQMYGWTILDADSATDENGYVADVMRVYDTAQDAIDGVQVDDESNVFYADQRRLGWGLIDSTEASTNGTGVYTNTSGNGEEYSVFDEKVKAWMNDTKYIRMTGGVEVNGVSTTYNYATEFAGLESATQATFGYSGEDPAYFYGTTPEIEHKADYKGEELTQETSVFSDSVIASGQDAWGESRVTFIGWSDWGKAWDVQYGPLYGAFVFPLAQLAMIIGTWFGYLSSAWGVIFSIIVIVFLTRGLGALLSLKGTSNQMKMQEVQTDVAKIKAKYAKYDLKAEPRYKQKQQQEIMALYRKKEINPMGSLGTIFITMPIFISLWIIISSLPAYKVVFMGNFSWAVSSFYGIFNAGWLFIIYLLVGVSVGLVQGISSKLPTWLSNKRKGIKRVDDATKEAAKKQNKTQNIMIGVFVFMGLTVPALFAFYWICSGFFTILLELVKHAWKVHVASEMKKNPAYRTPAARLFNK